MRERGERIEVAVVGTVNLDVSIRVPRLPAPGETVLGTDVVASPGGKAANQAVAAARQGARTALIGCVGDDDEGSQLLEFLGAEPGLDITGVTQLPGVASGRALVTVDDSGANTIASGAGANGGLDETVVHRWGSLIGEASVLLVQLGVPIGGVRAALEIARSVGTITVVDPAPVDAMTPDLLRSVDIITPNQTEAARLTGCSVQSLDDARVAAQVLVNRGCAAAVVTMAERGAYYASAVNPAGWVVEPHRIEQTVDPTAAGDAFNGALAAALARRAPVDEALAVAARAGASAASVRGAALSMPRRHSGGP